mgnify:CR=1 FL=1
MTTQDKIIEEFANREYEHGFVTDVEQEINGHLALYFEENPAVAKSIVEQAVVAGLYTAFARKTDLDQAILQEELAAAVPLSVTLAERVQALRAWARGRAVPAA